MKPIIPKDRAADIVLFRISQRTDPEVPVLPTLKQFSDSLLDLGYLDKCVSIDTLRRLFDGSMYPDLVDPSTDKVFEWALVPGGPRGKRSKSDELAILRQQFKELAALVLDLERAKLA